ncbi:MAG: hypothetical protein HYX96_05830 [Chloroflexi bacterium]|nr:hypothetical protein [Chloroflexota bacterium]
MRSPITSVVAGIVALLLLAVAVNYLFIERPFAQRPPPAPVQPSPPPPVLEPGKGFTAKIEDFRRSALEACASGQDKELSLSFTEQEINEQASYMLRQSQAGGEVPLDIRRGHIDLQPGGNFVTEVEAAAMNISFNITVKSRLTIQSGKLNIETLDIQMPVLLASFKEQIGLAIRMKTQEVLAQIDAVGLECAQGRLEVKYLTVSTGDQDLDVNVMAQHIEN